MKEIFEMLFFTISMIILTTLIFGTYENTISFENYFFKHTEEFEIIKYYIGNTRYGYNSYHIIAKHIKTNDIYDYKVNVNEFIKLGGKINE